MWASHVEHDLPWKDADVCIVTGDLASRSPDRYVYAALKKELDELFSDSNQKTWLTIPGNHDRKMWGILGRPDVVSFEEEFGKDWNRPRWPRYAPIVFLPIDSNPTQKSKNRIRWAYDFARGSAGEETTRIRKALEDVRRRCSTSFRTTSPSRGERQQRREVHPPRARVVASSSGLAVTGLPVACCIQRSGRMLPRRHMRSNSFPKVALSLPARCSSTWNAMAWPTT